MCCVARESTGRRRVLPTQQLARMVIQILCHQQVVRYRERQAAGPTGDRLLVDSMSFVSAFPAARPRL